MHEELRNSHRQALWAIDGRQHQQGMSIMQKKLPEMRCIGVFRIFSCPQYIVLEVPIGI